MSWPMVKLSQLVEIMHQGINTAADKVVYSESGMPIIQAKHLQDDGLVFDDVKFLGAQDVVKYQSKYIPKNQDILFSNIGTIGKSVIVKNSPEFMFAWNVFVIRPIHEKLDVSFLKYFLDKLLTEKYYDRFLTGGTVKFVNKKVMGDIEIPLPPLAEQKRIAAILDKADAIRRKRQQAIQLADDFLRAVFLEMFGDPVTNPKGWAVKKLGELIVRGPTNGLYKPSTDYGSGTRILRIDGFYDGVLSDQSKLKRVAISKDEIAKFQLVERSIVINRVNSKEYLGKCGFAQHIEEPTVFESNMMNFSVDEAKLNPRFLVQQLQMPNIKKQIATCAKDAVNQSSINQTDVKKLDILLPSIELQDKFEIVCKHFLESTLITKRSLEFKGYLFNSLSQKAFSGQL